MAGGSIVRFAIFYRPMWDGVCESEPQECAPLRPGLVVSERVLSMRSHASVPSIQSSPVAAFCFIQLADRVAAQE